MSSLIEDGAVVLFQGDSITDADRYRYDDNGPSSMGYGYAVMISAWFSALYPEKAVRFINRGIGGDRAACELDLHDGLAQDLACIAAQGQRLGSELGPGHPLMIAARNALATSRGVIADLSASTAPTTEAALRIIGDEQAEQDWIDPDANGHPDIG